MKILIIPGSDWIHGPKQYVHDIAEIMAEKHDVFVWHFDLFPNRKPCIQEVQNVKLVAPWSVHSKSLLVYYGANFVAHSLSFAKVVRELGIDVVMVLNLLPALWAFSLAPSSALKVFGFQDYFPESVSVYYKKFPNLFSRILETAALLVNKLGVKLADITLCPCLSLIEVARKMGCKRNYLLPNGVDIVSFTPKKSDEKLRGKLGLTKHTLVFYGLIESWLDFQTVLNGLKILKKEFSDVKLLIIGSTLTDYTKSLRKMLKKEGSVDDVILTGYIPNESVPYYLNAGSICLMPYKVNTFSGKIRLPLKLFIYSAMGKPILSVPLPEVKRLKPKHVFFYRNEKDFAHHASKLLNNEKLRNNLASYARGFAKNFEYHKLARRCQTILQENSIQKEKL